MEWSILDEFAPYNEEMQSISRRFGSELRSNYAAAVTDSGNNSVSTSLRTNTRKGSGIIDRIGAKFPRHGIYVEFGARKGYGGTKGSKWVRADGTAGTTAPASLGKMGTGNSPEQPWLFKTLDAYTETVADVAANHMANIAQKLALDSIPVTTNKRR